jgi:hypothetical protein
MNPIPPAALILVILAAAACQSQAPDYDSHWSPGSVENRSTFHNTSYVEERGASSFGHGMSASQDIALTFRRHFLNDNPTNPIQDRRGWGDPQHPYNMTAPFEDVWILGRGLVGSAWDVFAPGVLIPIDLVVGPALSLAAVGFDGTAATWEGGHDVTHPSDFRVRHSGL